MIEADACSDRLLRLGRIVRCIDACEAIDAGVDARDPRCLNAARSGERTDERYS
jgi:hypothetical protein